MTLARSLNSCFLTCNLQVIISISLLSPCCCKNHNSLAKLAVNSEVQCRCKAVSIINGTLLIIFTTPRRGLTDKLLCFSRESHASAAHVLHSALQEQPQSSNESLWTPAAWTGHGSNPETPPDCQVGQLPGFWKAPSPGMLLWELLGILIMRIITSREKHWYLLWSQ